MFEIQVDKPLSSLRRNAGEKESSYKEMLDNLEVAMINLPIEDDKSILIDNSIVKTAREANALVATIKRRLKFENIDSIFTTRMQRDTDRNFLEMRIYKIK